MSRVSSFVTFQDPIYIPLGLAFAVPDLTPSLIIISSNSSNTTDICIKAFVIEFKLQLQQSTQIDPTTLRHSFWPLTISIMSHNCSVLLASLDTSRTKIVSPFNEIMK